MRSLINQRNIKVIIILLMICAPAGLPLIRSGFYEPHDLHHLADIYEMVRAISSGQLPPRWAPDFLYGHGYPLFNFYYVLPFYLGALFFYLLGSLTISFKLVLLTGIIISVFGMYLFLREFVGRWAAFFGSVLYLYSPYRAVQLYVRGAMGEALAMSILPFVLLITARLARNPGTRKLAFLSIIFSFFILSHNYFWFLTLPYLVLINLDLFLKIKRKLKFLIYLGYSLLLTLGLVSYWLIPAVFEKKLINRLTPFLLVDHFPFIKQLILPFWGYGSSVWGPGDEMSFQIGVVNISVVAASVFSLLFLKNTLRKLKSYRLIIYLLIGFAMTVFMMNIRSLIIWKFIPFYNFIQFPWRLLAFTTLITAVLSAFVLEALRNTKIKPIIFKSFVVFLVIINLVLTFNYFRPEKTVFKTDDGYLSRFFAARTVNGTRPVISQDYTGWSEDYLLLPNWSNQKPEKLPRRKIETPDGQINRITELNAVNWTAEVILDSESEVIFNSLYFPGWSARIDGKSVKSDPEGPYGLVQTKVPPGEHFIEFVWKETRLRGAADMISIFSLFIVLTLIKPFWWKKLFRL